MSHPSDKAASFFLAGYNCAQATTAAFAEELGLEVEQALQLAAGLGAGMGGLRGTCGAVTAMTLVAGAKAGNYAPSDTAAKAAFYALVRKMHGEFVALHGTTCCRELLNRVAIVPRTEPSERTDEYHRSRPCVRFVMTAAEIVQRTLVLKANQ